MRNSRLHKVQVQGHRRKCRYYLYLGTLGSMTGNGSHADRASAPRRVSNDRAKDGDMIAWATDIRLRVERRAGQLLLRWRIAANVRPAAVLKNPRTVTTMALSRRRFESSANRSLPHRPMFPGSPLRPSSALSIAATGRRRPGAEASRGGRGLNPSALRPPQPHQPNRILAHLELQRSGPTRRLGRA